MFGMEGISESQRGKVEGGRWQFGVEEGCSKEGNAWGSGEQRTLERAPFEPPGFASPHRI